jgi:hypothetical protein
MGCTCFDDSIWEDGRFLTLPLDLRAVFPAVVARIGAAGDGALSDEELRVGLLRPLAFGRLAGALLAWGWLERDAEGRLGRAGMLAPSRERAARASESESDSDSDSYRESDSESDSDTESDARGELVDGADQMDEVDGVGGPVGYRERVARIADRSEGQVLPERAVERREVRVVVRPPVGPVPKTALFDRLRREGMPEAVLAGVARRVKPEDLWKEKYVRVVARNLMKA